MLQRLEIEFIGNVQGVGFRYSVQAIARRHPVVGHVKNLPNGNVEVVVEGEKTDLEAFLEEIRKKMARYIDHEQIAWMAGQGRFTDFRIAI